MNLSQGSAWMPRVTPLCSRCRRRCSGRRGGPDARHLNLARCQFSLNQPRESPWTAGRRQFEPISATVGILLEMRCLPSMLPTGLCAVARSVAPAEAPPGLVLDSTSRSSASGPRRGRRCAPASSRARAAAWWSRWRSGGRGRGAVGDPVRVPRGPSHGLQDHAQDGDVVASRRRPPMRWVSPMRPLVRMKGRWSRCGSSRGRSRRSRRSFSARRRRCSWICSWGWAFSTMLERS